MDDETNIVDLKKPKRPLSEKRLAQLREAGKKGLAAARISNHKPAAGHPRSGMAAQGPGWGGDAKGAGAGPEGLERARLAPRKDHGALAEEALDKMVEIMRGSEYEALQLAAAAKVRAEIVGTPINRTVTANIGDVSKLSDDDIQSELARFGRT